MMDSAVPGIPTAICRIDGGHEFYLHSRHDPIAEAKSLMKDVALRERTLYCVLGFALGYHVKDLLQRIPAGSHIAVIEPAHACLSARLRAAPHTKLWGWMDDERLHYLTHSDAQVIPLSLVDRMTRLRLLGLELIPHDPSILTAEEFYRTALSVIPARFPGSFQNHLAAIDRMMEYPLRNFWANLSHSWNGIPVRNLRGKWRGRKLVVVSAGPSLTAALETLRSCRGDALVLATASAVRILSASSILPDLVVSIDPYDANVAHFQGWDTAGIPLACPPRLHPDILAGYQGPKFLMLLQEDPPVPLMSAQRRAEFWQGGSVAFSALQLAHYMDANPIIFAGQDFAFANGHTHAQGSVVDWRYDLNALPNDFLLVPGASGQPVHTNRLYYSYLLYMQDYLAKSVSRRPRRHINTSQTGARIEGMETMPLEQALALEAAPGAMPRKMIGSALKPGQQVPAKAQQAALAAWTTEIDNLVAAQCGNFETLFDKFRGTSLYAHASRCYEDIYYLFENRYLSRQDETFRNRFLDHLRNVRSDLHLVASNGYN